MCIEALGRHGEAAKAAIPALRKCLDDLQVRPDAALALVRISRDEVGPRRGQARPRHRLAGSCPSLAALAAMEPPPAEALPALRPLLGDARVGGFALLALSRMDRATRVKAIPDLLALLGSNHVRAPDPRGGNAPGARPPRRAGPGAGAARVRARGRASGR